ncbi:hypothetical protein D6D02_00248 [Aureobasidium pullulans]|uniref:PB1 domain-containing protein n=1 Tax=Aureobasidium pullulans TaxID=5580 RepID=A0A4S8W9L8_AURPU|nr:hypothetical protein D6D24_01598 [Aureobasidium pullulans]THX96655.1 hypothetical protein D6D03_08658 [Aureobasidium pullulans]THY25369.1 hypothetical protein D6D02_00248 [Aureobasidium pullulans]
MIALTIAGADVDEPPLEDLEHYHADMIISITRHRRALNDATYTYQIPLSVQKKFSAKGMYEDLLSVVRVRLELSLDKEDSSIIWRMEDSGQIAFVRSPNSLLAALLDHKNAGKKVVQLFIVKNDNVTCVPGLDIAK